MTVSPELEAMIRAMHEARLTAPYPWFNADPAKCRLTEHLARAALPILEPSVAKFIRIATVNMPPELADQMAANWRDAILNGEAGEP